MGRDHPIRREEELKKEETSDSPFLPPTKIYSSNWWYGFKSEKVLRMMERDV